MAIAETMKVADYNAHFYVDNWYAAETFFRLLGEEIAIPSTDNDLWSTID